MPLIQKQKREVKRPITIKLEETLAERLTCYARFLESSRDHVVSNILQYVMTRDRDFAAYLASEPSAMESSIPVEQQSLGEASAKAGGSGR